MWSASETVGKSTPFGSGNRGIEGGSIGQRPMSHVERRTWARSTSHVRRCTLMDRPCLLVHVVHEDVSPEGPWCREVGLAVADLGDLPDEADQVVITGKHEGVDEDAGLAARGDLGDGLRDDERIEAEGVAVDTAVRACQR